jgi:hypothetical protein
MAMVFGLYKDIVCDHHVTFFACSPSKMGSIRSTNLSRGTQHCSHLRGPVKLLTSQGYMGFFLLGRSSNNAPIRKTYYRKDRPYPHCGLRNPESPRIRGLGSFFFTWFTTLRSMLLIQ